MAYTAIDDPEKYFQVKLYAGDSTNHALTFDGDSDMSPNWVLIKERDGTIKYYNFDSVRGVGKRLQPNINAAEDDTDSTWFQSFDSDGFSIGSEDNINDTGDNYVAWCWKESATAGFDIVSYSGAAATQTISHSLGVKPDFIIHKQRNATRNWPVYNSVSGALKYLYLDVDNALAGGAGNNFTNDTEPTSSVFTVIDDGGVGADGGTYIAYAWASKQGFSKIGSYTGNGNADGAFVYTGFRPAFVMIKRTNGTDHWIIYDDKRLGYNGDNKNLFANEAAAEEEMEIDILSNGFKGRTTDDRVNGDGDTYVYLAFAEAPFVNSNGVPCNAR